MNIFMHVDDYSIKRIEKVANGWNLYPAEKDSKPVFISIENYSGKMPPFFKWPWEEVKLKITRVSDYMVSAVLKDVKLFEIQETDYPSKVKETLKKGEIMERNFNLKCEEEDSKIEAALCEYMKTLPPGNHLEDEASRLPICLRAYLKAHLFKGRLTPDYLQRLNLMYLIFGIVLRIYRRHVDERELFDTTLATFRFKQPYPGYRIDVREIENAVKDKKQTDVTLEPYYEIDKLLNIMLPPIGDALLRRYLNHVIQEVLHLYANDNADFDRNKLKDGWTGKRICTDEQDYKYQYKVLHLHKYKSFIMPEIIADEDFDDFIRDYSLK